MGHSWKGGDVGNRGEGFDLGKWFWVALLLAGAFYALAIQSGAWEVIVDLVGTGKAGATMRGMGW